MPSFIERIGSGIKRLSEGGFGRYPGAEGNNTAHPIVSSGQTMEQTPGGNIQNITPFVPKLPTVDGKYPVWMSDMPTKGFGVVGTRKYAGYYGEEYLAKLQGQAGVQIYDAMFRSDPAVFRAIMSTINKIKNAKFYVKPPDKSPEAADRAEFLNYALFKSTRKVLNDCLNDILTYFIYGFSVCEPAFRQEKNKKWGYCWVLDTWGWRSPKTIWQWYIRDEELTAVRQLSWGDDLRFTFIPGKAFCGLKKKGEKVAVPWSALIVFTHFRTGDNMEGISPERPMYGPSLRKDRKLMIDLEGVQNNAKGIRNLETDADLIQTELGKGMVEKFREATIANVPLMETIQGKQKFNFHETHYQATEVQRSIQMENNETAKVMQSEDSETGLNGMGARAMSQAKQGGHSESVKPEAEYLCQKINTVLEYLEKTNFGEQKDYCTVAVEGIDSKPDKEDAEKLQIVNNMISNPATPPEMVAYLCSHFDIPLLGKELDDKIGTPQEDAAAAAAAKQESASGGQTNFSESFVSRRTLTQYEKKVQFAEMKSRFDFLDKEYADILTTSLKNYVIPKYKSDLAAALKRGDNIHDIPLGYKGQVLKRVKDFMERAVMDGRAQAISEVASQRSKSVKLAEVDPKKLPAGVYTWIKTHAESATDDLYSGLQKNMKQSALSGYDDNYQDDAIAFDAAESGESYISKLNNLGVGIIPAMSVNAGRRYTFKQLADEIQGFQHSSILDDLTCDLCDELDGATYKYDDPDSDEWESPLHGGCRCVDIPITIYEMEPDKWDGLDAVVAHSSNPAKLEKMRTLSEVKEYARS